MVTICKHLVLLAFSPSIPSCIIIWYDCLFFFFLRGGTFTFSFQISPLYPHDAPKVKCKTKVIKFSVACCTKCYCSVFLTELPKSIHPSGVPSQHWLGRKCLPEHSSRRLEACAQHKHYHIWIISSFHGTYLFFHQDAYLKIYITLAGGSPRTGAKSWGSSESWRGSSVEG